MPESTLAVVNIIRLGPFPFAGGPEPRTIRHDNPNSIREYPLVMIRVGRALPESNFWGRLCLRATPKNL